MIEITQKEDEEEYVFHVIELTWKEDEEEYEFEVIELKAKASKRSRQHFLYS